MVLPALAEPCAAAERARPRDHDHLQCRFRPRADRVGGFKVVPLRLDRSGLNVFNDVRIASDLIALLRRERPALIHCIGMKPILIGTRCPTGRRHPHPQPLRGFGYLFSSSHLKARLLRPLVMLRACAPLSPVTRSIWSR